MSVFFNDTATPEIYARSLHDALPIYVGTRLRSKRPCRVLTDAGIWITEEDYYVADLAVTCSPVKNTDRVQEPSDRKSTRLNSSHANISYAVFCLKKNQTTSTAPNPHH